MNTQNCLVCEKVVKSFGKKTVLNGVNLTIEPAETALAKLRF